MSTNPMRTLRFTLIALALASSAATCGEQPIVHLGRVPVRAGDPAPPPTGGASGVGLGHDETRECQEIDPVCGVDNRTYQNACIAFLSGIAVLRRGPC